MWYIGIDVHWMISVICVLNQDGKEVFTKTVRGSWDILLQELRKVKNPFKVCFEASTGYGHLHDRVSQLEHCQAIVVAHPGQVRLIFRAKRKTDRIDARKLAQLLFFDSVPPVYVPRVDVRAWRATIVHRERLVRDRTQSKNQMRALLRSNGIVAPKGLWSAKGLQWLQGLEFVSQLDAMRRDLLLERIVSLVAMITRVEKHLNGVARKHPGVALLRTIRGVGPRTAEAVVAYIDNPKRFSRVRSIGTYFGLVPCLDESAGKGRFGHITRQGPAPVRRLLTEAAWQAVRHCPQLKCRFDRFMRNDPGRKRIAIVATAHLLIRAMLAMLRDGAVWDPQRLTA